jgi:hypothetical protein
MEKRDKSDIRSQISADEKLGLQKNLDGPSPLRPASILLQLIQDNSKSTKTGFLMLMLKPGTQLKHTSQEPIFFFNTHVHTHKTILTCSI